MYLLFSFEKLKKDYLLILISSFVSAFSLFPLLRGCARLTAPYLISHTQTFHLIFAFLFRFIIRMCALSLLFSSWIEKKIAWCSRRCLTIYNFSRFFKTKTVGLFHFNCYLKMRCTLPFDGNCYFRTHTKNYTWFNYLSFFLHCKEPTFELRKKGNYDSRWYARSMNTALAFKIISISFWLWRK